MLQFIGFYSDEWCNEIYVKVYNSSTVIFGMQLFFKQAVSQTNIFVNVIVSNGDEDDFFIFTFSFAHLQELLGRIT